MLMAPESNLLHYFSVAARAIALHSQSSTKARCIGVVFAKVVRIITPRIDSVVLSAGNGTVFSYQLSVTSPQLYIEIRNCNSDGPGNN